jgi:hypothetical protein
LEKDGAKTEKETKSLKWTLKISDAELEKIIQENPRKFVHNALAQSSPVLPIHQGRYGTYGSELPAWEEVCPGITKRIQRIKSEPPCETVHEGEI